MKNAAMLKYAFLAGMMTAAGPSIGYAVDLSPGSWPKEIRAQLETTESLLVSPLVAQSVTGTAGMVSGTVSPLAVHAGTEVLRHGGSAADAAAATALTQVTTQLGSVVSYAGIFTMLYYDAKAHKVYSMDAGYNSYLNEKDPENIPVGDLGTLPVNSMPKPTEGGAKGRETLVPGFMAGLEAMQSRFGRLPFTDLFAPAIWYAENGVRISPMLQYYFTAREKFLARTPEGQQFLRQAGNQFPKTGDLFVQSELANTLKEVSRHGASYMYTGRWAEDFVRIVRREGGAVTAGDLKRYKPIWSEPYKETVFGHTVYVNGPPHRGAYALITGLNLAETLRLDQKGPYWQSAETFQTLTRIGQFVERSPQLSPRTESLLQSKNIETSAAAQLTKNFARAVAPLLGQVFAPPTDNGPKHSNAIVAIDRDGNIAVVTHTINAVIWGDTGIVVDGIPIPDSASFQQANLAKIKPGDRLPHQIIDTISFDSKDVPVLATASIGFSLIPESIRVLVGVLGQNQSLTEVMAAPPILATVDIGRSDIDLSKLSISIPQGAYSADFITKVKAAKFDLKEVPALTSAGLRATLAAVSIDGKTGMRSGVNQPGVMVFNEGE